MQTQSAKGTVQGQTQASRPIFQNIQSKRFDTSTGPCDLPILYRDGSLLAVGYRVPLERVRSQFADVPLEVMPLLGKALVVLAMFEYRDTTIGPYHEIGLSVYAKRIGSKPSQLKVLRRTRDVEDVGLHVFNLPVDTPNACAAGVELWGYPKYVSDITTNFTSDQVNVQLGQEFALRHQRSRWAIEKAGIPFITYTVHRDRYLRTITEVDHPVRIDRGRSVELELLGEGPTATTIRALGLDQLRPSFAIRTDELCSVLPAGQDMGGLESA